MAGITIAIAAGIGIPAGFAVYAAWTKRFWPFVCGVLAFCISQPLLRIPLMTYLGAHSTSYAFFSAVHPILFALLVGLSAGVFEETARYVIMRFWMKRRRNWAAGFLFGAGHGGIEALLVLGVPAAMLLVTGSPDLHGSNTLGFVLGSMERLFAIALHIGLSLLVMQGVLRRKFVYLFAAILIHGMVDAMIGIVPHFVPKEYVLAVIEGMVAATAAAVFFYGLRLKRKEVFV